jgi:hypothetical protein
MKEINVKGDGNCLFRCIAIKIYGKETYHTLVRQHMIEFANQNKQIYGKSANLDGSIESWIGRMSNCGNPEFDLPGEFGDAFALELLSWMYKFPIYIEIRDLISDQMYYRDQINDWMTKPVVNLILRGQHYTIRTFA